MISKILTENNFDPSVILGAGLRELNGRNFRLGKSKILVLEACEYFRAFLNYSPRIIVLNTLDPDHMDYFKNFDEYKNAFREFSSKLPLDGYFFANIDDEDVRDVLQSMQARRFPPHNTFTYGGSYATSDFYIKKNVIIKRGTPVGELKLHIPGEHNRTNALAAFAVCSTLGIASSDIIKSLNRYNGAARRFETIGKLGRTDIIDDYAHHPAEITATLNAAREKYPKERICVVFQPHQYSRTKALLREFGESFAKADSVIIPDIYAARDSLKDKRSVSAEKLAAEINKHGRKARFGNGMENTIAELKKRYSKYGVIITMGAGDVWQISHSLIKNPTKRASR